MLEAKPSHRLTAAEVLEHAWFTGNWNSDSRSLHHVHARLDSLRTSTRQLPVRKFRPGDWLVREGEVPPAMSTVLAWHLVLIHD